MLEHFSQIKREFKATEFWFYRTMMSIQWTEYGSSEKEFKQNGNKKNTLLRYMKRKLKSLEFIMRKVSLNICH